jgi:hypothetical protein
MLKKAYCEEVIADVSCIECQCAVSICAPSSSLVDFAVFYHLICPIHHTHHANL